MPISPWIEPVGPLEPAVSGNSVVAIFGDPFWSCSGFSCSIWRLSGEAVVWERENPPATRRGGLSASAMWRSPSSKQQVGRADTSEDVTALRELPGAHTLIVADFAPWVKLHAYAITQAPLPRQVP